MLLSKSNLDIAVMASKDETRPALMNLRITPEYTEATSGRILGRVEIPEEKAEDFPEVPGFSPNGSEPVKEILIPAKSALEISKSIPRSPKLPILEYANIGAVSGANTERSTVCIAVTDLDSPRVSSLRVDPNPYPNSDQVFPENIKDSETGKAAEPVIEIAFAASQLKILADFCSKHTKGGTGQIRLKVYTPTGAMAWECRSASGIKAYGLVMPMRISE